MYKRNTKLHQRSNSAGARRRLVETKTWCDGDITITLVLAQLNKVPRLELEHLEEYTGGSATRAALAELVVAELGLLLLLFGIGFVGIARLHVAFEHAKDADGVLVPFGGVGDEFIAKFLSGLVFVVVHLV